MTDLELLALGAKALLASVHVITVFYGIDVLSAFREGERPDFKTSFVFSLASVVTLWNL